MHSDMDCNRVNSINSECEINLAVPTPPLPPSTASPPPPARSGAVPTRADAPVAVPPVCDLLVVGGGVNGAGIARDAAGRGWSVVLCERDDLAEHTSSASTKLIHGGLRYLEHYEFALVRKALREREVLLRNSPHIMRPLRFVLPHDPSMRPVWMMRVGLFLYDHLARRERLPGSAGIDLRRHPAGAALRPTFTRGFVYSDGWVDDARLVVLNAIGAAERGATVLTRTECIEALPMPPPAGDPGGLATWQATLRDARGALQTVRARALVNATGQWAARFLRDGAHRPGTRSLRLIKGSHIVVPRLFDHPYAYILQSPDQRIVFAIPYENDFTLIGTTDVEEAETTGKVAISAAEVTYLCELINRYFTRGITPADVVWSYSGVRPLMDDESGDPSAVTRDYSLEIAADGPPCLTVWGGKITTYRKLAEEAVDRIETILPAPAAAATVAQRSGWTASEPLPGGDLPPATAPGAPSAAPVAAVDGEADLDRYRRWLQERHPWLPVALATRWAASYGTRTVRIIGAASRPDDLGAQIAPGLHEAELRYLRDHEWARSGDDALWRRSKLGLHLTAVQRNAVAAWFARGEAG